ncbi:hypothetical protein [Polaromonas naphthalenivorans]|uniref:Uncharacterized protein n=1 Tax=Polaromonas naphthalenivorans (strain CJ2) TaxID=365044 RepID=A1VVB4_POLNA|nr:hypothetical protein [Polaromonas naphthalenivorans]ABM39592.1 hypothetical protein Pnap_4310 [Polaromonas naphthalenivorans CJ2]
MLVFKPNQGAPTAMPMNEADHAALELAAQLLGQPSVAFHHPQSFFDALDAELLRQKRRIMRLRNDAKKAATLIEKLDILKQVSPAENALHRMRLSIFDAQDAICECLKSGSNVAFDSHAGLFPKVAALLKATFTNSSQQ